MPKPKHFIWEQQFIVSAVQPIDTEHVGNITSLYLRNSDLGIFWLWLSLQLAQ